MKYFSNFKHVIMKKMCYLEKIEFLKKKKWIFRIFMHTCDIFSDGIGNRFSSFSIDGDPKGKYSIGGLNTWSF